MYANLVVLFGALTVISATGHGHPGTHLLPNGCPSDWRVDKRLPHETKCGLFYICSHGEKVLFECKSGTHFNARSEDCEWPKTAKCTLEGGHSEESDSGDHPSSESVSSESASSESGSDEQTEINNGKFPNGCPRDWRVDLRLPHKKDCRLFYMCTHGRKVPFVCPANLHFNSKTQDCDWPDKAGCSSGGNGGHGGGNGGQGGGNGGHGGGNGGHGSGEGGHGSGEGGHGSGEGGSLPNGCPSDWSVDKRLPHKRDCTKFYMCTNGEKVVFSCPANLHFNAATQDCDWPEDAGCKSTGGGGNGGDGDGDGDGGNGSVTPDWICGNRCNVKSWAHKTDCNKFWRCEGRRAVLGTCSEGLYYNEAAQTCDLSCNVSCDKKSLLLTGEADGYSVFMPWSEVDGALMELLEARANA